MSDSTPRVWQMAAGDGARLFSDVFLEYDVMFLGPGRYGEYDPEVYRKVGTNGLAGKGIIANIAALRDKIQPSDVVLLRTNLTVRAIGLVANTPYEHRCEFDDVYGWDLEHTRRVIWQEQLNSELELLQRKEPLFVGRRQIPTFTRVHEAPILTKLEPLLSKLKQRPLKSMPVEFPKPLPLEIVGQELFARGLSNEAVDKVIAAIERQRRLQHWYHHYGERSNRPTEHEVVAHTVLPFFLALGWSEQLLAIEWQKIDLAAFSKTPTTKDSCVLVCEAKIRNHGLQNVKEQAISYTRKLNLHACCKVLITDGARFYLYQRQSAQEPWGEKPVGYLNVEKIRTNHITAPNTNAIDTIMALTPTAVGHPFS